jgi:hypothetical protein
LMNGMYNTKNISNKEFQHCLESRLIEVMNVKMLPIQFVSSVNVIQMWLIKVIRNLENISNQEFQHYVESRLIDIMIQNMLLIQFVSSVNLIKLWLMKVSNNLKSSSNQEFRYQQECERLMNSKNYELIYDE